MKNNYEGTWVQVSEKYYVAIGEANKNESYADYKCICGCIKSVRCSDVNRGKSKSCGCLKIDNQTTHGAWKEDLFNTWSGIKARCYNRQDKRYKAYGEKGVTMDETWYNDFWEFKRWCMDNGWKRGMFLCRSGDTGNYEPSNVRVDTPQSNVEEAIAMYWNVRKPCGQKLTIFNLAKFCRENNLDSANMHRVMVGSQQQYKGWTTWI